MIVLDTDALIKIFDRHSAKGDEALKILIEEGDDVAITVINLHEILYDLEKYAKPVRGSFASTSNRIQRYSVIRLIRVEG
ncbi:MAG: PIN domain-containing protein [Candidatus Bathyarchaeia archaeon]